MHRKILAKIKLGLPLTKKGAGGEDLYCSSDNERERLYLHLLKEAEERLKEEV